MLETLVAPGRLRYGPGGGRYRIVATAGETAHRHFVMEASEPPGGGPPLHVHKQEDELFVVLEGEITFYIGGRIVTVPAGGSAFVPHGVAHCFKNRANGTARVLVTFTPGDIEGFFDYGLPIDGREPTEEDLLERALIFGPLYGVEVIGPSPL